MLTQLIKAGGIKLALQLAPLILTMIGNDLIKKDANNTGTDDMLGGICLAASPAVDAYETGNGPALYRALSSVYSGLGAWLQANNPTVNTGTGTPGVPAPQHHGGIGGVLGGIGKDVLQAETGIDLHHNAPQG